MSKHDRIVAGTMRLVYKVFQIYSAIVSVSYNDTAYALFDTRWHDTTIRDVLEYCSSEFL